MIPIVPAIIPTSAAHLMSVLSKLHFSPEIHVDVVDGKFVPFTSWPYQSSGSPKEVATETDAFTLEVDLMVENPLVAADEWLKAGADMLVFHVETITPEAFARFADSTKISVGISIKNGTPLTEIDAYMESAEYIQLMGIAEIGSQGQSFDERVLTRIEQMRLKYPTHSITIDGSVNSETIVRLAEAGAHRFICGSAITKAEDPARAHAALAALITN
jgi:ribulose-phosphate 3-epimerase